MGLSRFSETRAYPSKAAVKLRGVWCSQEFPPIYSRREHSLVIQKDDVTIPLNELMSAVLASRRDVSASPFGRENNPKRGGTETIEGELKLYGSVASLTALLQEMRGKA